MEEKILVTRPLLPPLEEYVEEIYDIFESRWLTNMGVKHEALTEELRRFFDVPEITFFRDDHLALEFTLQALGLRGEVVTTPFTFASTTWAIIRAKLTPVLRDTDPETYTPDPARLEVLVTPRTAAILSTHVYDTLCGTDTPAETAARHHSPLIYDATHTSRVKRDGKSTASFGSVAMFSLHAVRVFHTIEDDTVCCHDSELNQELFRLGSFGIQENETYCIGGSDKMGEFETVMGLCNLRYFLGEITKRKQVYERYRKRLTGVAGLKLPPQQASMTPSYAYLPVVFPGAYGEARDGATGRLQARGYFPRKYFCPCTDTFPFLGQRYAPGSTSIAAIISRRVLTLPPYADLECADVDEICRILRREVREET